jgi:hypothetical protein
MYISLEEAIAMHAKMGLARFGRIRAKERALSTADHLHRKGDEEGAEVWARVATELDRSTPEKASPSKRPAGPCPQYHQRRATQLS